MKLDKNKEYFPDKQEGTLGKRACLRKACNTRSQRLPLNLPIHLHFFSYMIVFSRWTVFLFWKLYCNEPV